MNTERVIVILLLISILLSVITLTIIIGTGDLIKTTGESFKDEAITATVVLDIVRNPAKGEVSQ